MTRFVLQPRTPLLPWDRATPVEIRHDDGTREQVRAKKLQRDDQTYWVAVDGSGRFFTPRSHGLGVVEIERPDFADDLIKHTDDQESEDDL